MLINFNDFLPKNYIDVGGAIIAVIVVIGIAYGIFRWRAALVGKSSSAMLSTAARAKVLANGLAIDVFYQKPIADCSRARWFSHLAMFWGFLGLAVTTTMDEILNPSAGPLPISSPVRILGNISGIFFLAGVSISLGRRLVVRDVRKNSTVGDAIFLVLLFLTGLTGFITEIFSQFNLVPADSFSFWSHLVLVAALLASAPFTKFVHAIGRPILLLFKRTEIEKEKLSSEARERPENLAAFGKMAGIDKGATRFERDRRDRI
jgi:nitrate reductase gamma subunit